MASIASDDYGGKPLRSKRTQRIGSPTLQSPELTRYDLLTEQGNRRTTGSAMLLSKLRATLRQVQHHAGRYVIDVGEAGFRRQHTSPS